MVRRFWDWRVRRGDSGSAGVIRRDDMSAVRLGGYQRVGDDAVAVIQFVTQERGRPR